MHSTAKIDQLTKLEIWGDDGINFFFYPKGSCKSKLLPHNDRKGMKWYSIVKLSSHESQRSFGMIHPRKLACPVGHFKFQKENTGSLPPSLFSGKRFAPPIWVSLHVLRHFPLPWILGERVKSRKLTYPSEIGIFFRRWFSFSQGRICYKPLGWGAFQPSHEPQVVSLAPEAPAMGATRPRQQEALASGKAWSWQDGCFRK